MALGGCWAGAKIAPAVALAHSGLEWTGKFANAGEGGWKALKPSTPWGETPILEGVPGVGTIGHELTILQLPTQLRTELGWKWIENEELTQLKFLDETEKLQKRNRKLAWADDSSDNAQLATVKSFSSPSHNLARRVRSRAQRQADKAEARERRKRHRKPREEGENVCRAEAGTATDFGCSVRLTGPSGSTHVVPSTSEFVIGRHVLGIDSGKVHREHLRVRWQDDWVVTRLGTNPAWLRPRQCDEDGFDELSSSRRRRLVQKIDRDRWTPLADGDALFLSKIEESLAVRVTIAPSTVPGDEELSSNDEESALSSNPMPSRFYLLPGLRCVALHEAKWVPARVIKLADGPQLGHWQLEVEGNVITKHFNSIRPK